MFVLKYRLNSIKKQDVKEEILLSKKNY